MSFSRPAERADGQAVVLWWLGLAGLALAFVLLDVYWLGLPLFAVLGCLPLSAALLGMAVVRWLKGQRSAGLRAGLRALLFMGCAALSAYACRAAVSASSTEARQVVAALRAYRQAHGAFPRRLGQLVPDFLQTLPAPAGHWGKGRFQYGLDDQGRPRLAWAIDALADRADYDFDQDQVRFRK